MKYREYIAQHCPAGPDCVNYKKKCRECIKAGHTPAKEAK